MTADPPERPPRAEFVAALSVPRNAKIGLALGTAFAVALYVFFVVIGRSTRPVLYVGLAFVVALTSAALIATALTIVSAWRLRSQSQE